ncbi:MAG: hypothetical protein JW940_31580 [Polyangiaceae bacterium]|nr:hypothetical protein [Polyangiaceae bacterium]
MAEFRTVYASELMSAASRFLSKTVQHALADGWRKPDDFLRHFTPETILRSLADAHELRAELLVKAANVHEKLARKKSIESGAEDLRLALEEKLTDPPSVLSLLPPDECVRYLAAPQLWRFLFEEEFWTAAKGGPEHARAVTRMTFLLECALEQNLVTLRDLFDAIGFEQIAAYLPPERLRKLMTHAMTIARSGEALTEDQLLTIIPFTQLVGELPLALIWEAVVVRKVAVPSGFVASGGELPVVQPPPAEGTPAEKDKPASAAGGASPPPSSPQSSSTPDAAAGEARQAAVAKLTSIGRLPPSHESLATPILLSIESMYEELNSLTSDDDREVCIRDSFPNEGHLRTALLALIELLDPTIDVHKPPISDAEADALVKVVLFEERQRQEQGQGARQRSSMRPPPLPTARGGAPGAPARNIPPPRR